MAPRLALDVRKVIARRSLLEFAPGYICNLGFGISQEIGAVAFEEGIADQLVLTVEQGIFGGVPVAGNEGGAGFNYQAMLDQPAMFDFYDGGGLDITSLSFAEVDAQGNVNVHSFAGRVRGPGGFPNISARTKKVCFVGTLTTGGLRLDFSAGRPQIVNEGRMRKFVPEVREVTFSGRLARERGQEVRYITERAVFAMTEAGLTLVEVADGVDVRRDVLEQLGFTPARLPSRWAGSTRACTRRDGWAWPRRAWATTRDLRRAWWAPNDPRANGRADDSRARQPTPESRHRRDDAPARRGA